MITTESNVSLSTNLTATATAAMMTPASTNTLDNSKQSKPVRRGRRAVLPPEQREQVRRVKKQNMERRRRACISDKMAALHDLAMNLIGEDATNYQKTEKVDILSMCYSIFRNLVTVVKEQPDIHMRVLQLNDELQDKQTVETASLAQSEDGIDETSTHTSTYPHSPRSLSPVTPSLDGLKINASLPMEGIQQLEAVPIKSLSSSDSSMSASSNRDSGLGHSMADRWQHAILPDFRSTFYASPMAPGAIRMPLKHRMRPSKSPVYLSNNLEGRPATIQSTPLSVAHTTSASSSDSFSLLSSHDEQIRQSPVSFPVHNRASTKNPVWRPYLD